MGKADLPDRPFRDAWFRCAPEYDATVEVSGVTREGCEALVEELLARMPFGPQLYPEGQTTNTTLDFRIAELDRKSVV